MLGGYHVHSGGDEPSSLSDSRSFYICGTDFCTVASILKERTFSWSLPTKRIENKYFLRKSARGRCVLMSATPQIPQLHDKCPESPQCVASFQEWFLKHFFSQSPFKRQSLRLGNLGTELNNSKKIMIKK